MIGPIVEMTYVSGPPAGQSVLLALKPNPTLRDLALKAHSAAGYGRDAVCTLSIAFADDEKPLSLDLRGDGTVVIRGDGDMLLGPDHTATPATCRIRDITSERMYINAKTLVCVQS